MKKNNVKQSQDWALILGASSGFGGAISIEMARSGYNIIGIHLDRHATMVNVQKIVKTIESFGQSVDFFNINAADNIQRNETLDEIQQRFKNIESASIKVLVHSLAFGSLRPLIGSQLSDSITQPQIEMTLDVMANSLIYWTQGIIFRSLMKQNGRIFAITSSGSQTCIPHYGAISAAKCVLESYVRQLAMELGPKKISVNAILAGITDTPALRKIPNAEMMIDVATRKNPSKRLTLPIDVAKAISLLCHDEASWISGGIIHVDGGESVVSYVGQELVS